MISKWSGAIVAGRPGSATRAWAVVRLSGRGRAARGIPRRSEQARPTPLQHRRPGTDSQPEGRFWRAPPPAAGLRAPRAGGGLRRAESAVNYGGPLLSRRQAGHDHPGEWQNNISDRTRCRALKIIPATPQAQVERRATCSAAPDAPDAAARRDFAWRRRPSESNSSRACGRRALSLFNYFRGQRPSRAPPGPARPDAKRARHSRHLRPARPGSTSDFRHLPSALALGRAPLWGRLSNLIDPPEARCQARWPGTNERAAGASWAPDLFARNADVIYVSCSRAYLARSLVSVCLAGFW